MSIWPQVAEQITATTGESFAPRSHRAVGGGCINTAYVLEAGARRYFVKTNRASGLDMFEAEADGLAELQRVGTVRVPAPICSGVAADTAYLVMEYLSLGRSGAGAAERLGRKLAGLHRTTAPLYGWHRDNTIGSTPQVNTQSSVWVDFWREQRLGFQLGLSARQGHGGRLQRVGERLLADLDAFFTGYDPEPSLLHGDLWSGNYAVEESGEPVIFDPAIYYGDREADLAMTELFGGFPQAFYRAYDDAWPLDAGYRVRRTLYNVYHVLNHLNLFGGGYGSQAERMMASLLSEIR